MLTAKHKLEFKSGKRTAKTIVEAETQVELPTPGRLPRITKMMALAIRLDQLIKSGQVTDQAALARVGHVSRARLTQLLDLTLLAPTIQETILSLPELVDGRAAVTEMQLRQISRLQCWMKQKAAWDRLYASCY
jgi:hypothetical protein